MDKEREKLTALLDADKDAVMTGLRENRAPESAAAVLEKAVNRVALRYLSDCESDALGETARTALDAIGQASAFLTDVSDVHLWDRRTQADDGGKKVPALSAGLLIAGVALVGCGLALPLLQGLLPAAIGCALLAFGGRRSAPRKALPAPSRPEDTRMEFRVDPDKAWRDLRGLMLQADASLAALEAEAEVRKAPNGEPDRAMMELMATLMEIAYRGDGEDARELRQTVAFYLHGRGIEVVEDPAGRESCFEFLPAASDGVIVPALVKDGRVLKKGLAGRTALG